MVYCGNNNTINRMLLPVDIFYSSCQRKPKFFQSFIAFSKNDLNICSCINQAYRGVRLVTVKKYLMTPSWRCKILGV